MTLLTKQSPFKTTNNDINTNIYTIIIHTDIDVLKPLLQEFSKQNYITPNMQYYMPYFFHKYWNVFPNKNSKEIKTSAEIKITPCNSKSLSG